MQRPTAISVIGWGAIAVGALSFVSALMVLVVFVAVPQTATAETSGPPLSRWMHANLEWLAAVQLVLAAATIVAGTALLRLKRWARVFLSALAWLALVYTIGFGTVWLTTFATFGDNSPLLFRVVFTGMSALVLLVFIVPLVLVIRALRSPAVRAALP